MTPLDATSASLPFAEFAFWGGTRLSRPQTDQMVTPLSFSSLGSRCIGAFAPFADSREKAVVELPIRANLRTLHSTSDKIGFRIFLPKPLQHRKQNRRKRDVACRRAAFGCGDHDLGPSRAIELLSIDALGKEDRSIIVYNDKIRILNIPLRAYDWQVNGKSPIEWIMERYAVTVNRDSQIRNDPNDWCREHGQPRYILDLIGRIVNVSIQTLDLMASLPPLSFKTN